MLKLEVFFIKSPDEGLHAYNQLIQTEWVKLSEADTKSKIIEPLFIECLNWTEENITREDNIKDVGYSDYIFKRGDKDLFIIEAKKVGISFNIPPNYKSRSYKIGRTISQCKDLKNALRACLKNNFLYSFTF